jgi:hypothetical protein
MSKFQLTSNKTNASLVNSFFHTTKFNFILYPLVTSQHVMFLLSVQKSQTELTLQNIIQ